MTTFKFLLLCLTMQLCAAQSFSQKSSFYQIMEIGALNGNHASSLSLQGSFGWKYNKTYLGTGIGVDYYRFRSVPIFLQLRQEFGNGNKRLFVYGNGGYNIDWLTVAQQDYLYFELPRYKGGHYYDAGVGLKLPLVKNGGLIFSGGFTEKKIRKEIRSNGCPVGMMCQDYTDASSYVLRRIVLRVGWAF